MKCICGYEQKEDFKCVRIVDSLGPGMTVQHTYRGMYYCPKCGTVKVKVEKEE